MSGVVQSLSENPNESRSGRMNIPLGRWSHESVLPSPSKVSQASLQSSCLPNAPLLETVRYCRMIAGHQGAVRAHCARQLAGPTSCRLLVSSRYAIRLKDVGAYRNVASWNGEKQDARDKSELCTFACGGEFGLGVTVFWSAMRHSWCAAVLLLCCWQAG